MAALRFLRDYRGKATNEHYFQAGEVVDFPWLDVEQLYAEGVVEPAQDDADAEDGQTLADLTVAELQNIARERGISYSGLRKAELVEALS